MTKSLCTLFLLSLLVSLPVGSAWAHRPAPAKTQYRWERMSIVPVLPSQVFAKLGLTHSTRYGFTRDGFTKKTPDPTFPAGLTDVVPYDASHLLLIRGTAQGLAQFRARVLATENDLASTGRWHVMVALLPTAGDGSPLGGSVQQDVLSDAPFQVTLGNPGNLHTFQLRIHVEGNAAMSVSCQSGLSLMPAPAFGAGVWTPGQIWTPSVTRPALPGGTVVFDDLAAARQSARRSLGLPDETDAQDYEVRVTVTPLVLNPVAASSPPEDAVPPRP